MRAEDAIDGRPRAVVAWSSGKDSAYALHKVRRAGEFDVVGLLTTVGEADGAVSMHAVRPALLRRQAAELGLPLLEVPIPSPCPNEVYGRRMAEALERLRRDGVTCVIFGDLFLEDVRAYREARMAGSGLRPVFPLWGRSTERLALEMIDAGMEALLTCVDLRWLPSALAGRRFDRELLTELPPPVDPCGERGEFHTVVTAGPIFRRPIPAVVGDSVERDGLVFSDVIAG
jgi:uncharacterized protein (TIGR00290 family)